ncbi:5-formyltetrahydrofolate cyclo-ligase [Bacillus sp. M6-12]|uniref:5-formyltetrahydrofolate cyclo-ligase n=1 Tax=Bacillus sp. M6-12 TaxID=2054166 RepID=UPI000C7792DB|nr:5-formyltetrahydrofolate cyclo-ligase [Bacillus sp. M6-12]PLS15236.1 5-formyltetrahydrofolate cyclo-ligase [Bacillus sp. M6-12]
MNKAKKVLRNEMKRSLAEISEEEYSALSQSIADRLFLVPEWSAAKTVGITISAPPEVGTSLIIQRAWEEGKTVAVPKCEPNNRTLDFREITDFNQLEIVYFGLKEPNPLKTKSYQREAISLMVVPGLAFTADGHRLGFGGGYYDRYLPQYRGPKISLAFDQQIIPCLPHETHDVRVDKIITPTRTVFCHGN